MANELEGMTLADLTGIDTTGMEARRMGEVLPKMFAQFECTKVESKQNDDPVTGKVKNFQFTSEWKLLGIETLFEKGIKEEELIGKIHFENRFITNPDGIKFTLGFLEDVGIKERGPLGSLWNKQLGRKIAAVVAHRKDPNDSEKIYSSLTKIKVLA